MTANKHVALDLDDVILDFVGGILRWLKTEYSAEVDPEKIVDFNLRPFLDPIIGKNWWTAFRERDWLWPNFDAVPGAIGAIEQLRREGWYLEIVTSKPDWAEYATWKWLGKWRPKVQRVTIIGPEDNKADYTTAPVLVDDKADNIREFIEAGRQGILFTRPHNRNANIPGAIRAGGWADVLDLLRASDGTFPQEDK